ncbi:hypothetical protein ACLOJK_041101, partial [Asimina triloba]
EDAASTPMELPLLESEMGLLSSARSSVGIAVGVHAPLIAIDVAHHRQLLWPELKKKRRTTEDATADDGGAAGVRLRSRRIQHRPVIADLLDGLDPSLGASPVMPVMVSPAVRCG